MKTLSKCLRDCEPIMKKNFNGFQALMDLDSWLGFNNHVSSPFFAPSDIIEIPNKIEIPFEQFS
jgi:hypothetical protein